MHILLTNDDGPPNPSSSPYLATFLRVLTSPPFNHTVSVVVPAQQRSWIGKAHLLPPSSFAVTGPGAQRADIITPKYYDPKTGETYHVPPGSSCPGYWVTAPGTPASCVQLALFHHGLLFPHLREDYMTRRKSSVTGTRPGDITASPASPRTPAQDARRCPFDLIISGPNFGRNTTAAFALSSGTIGGALEGAVCGVRAIALSFAFYTRQESEALVEEASHVSMRLVERLCKDWAETDSRAEAESDARMSAIMNGDEPRQGSTTVDLYSDIPDLYSINVPLVEGISKVPIHWTWMLPNQWNTGCLYKVVKPEDISDAETFPVAPSFRWAPTFGDMWKTVDESPEGNDGKVIRQKEVSVTPLKANFQSLFGSLHFTGEVKL